MGRDHSRCDIGTCGIITILPLTLPWREAEGVLPSATRLATSRVVAGSSRGQVSRSVLSRGTGSRVPLGTVVTWFLQDIHCRILIAVQYHATAMTDMCSNTERLLNHSATVGAFLAGIVRWHGDDGDSMQEPIAGEPLQEDPPSCIMDGFSQLAITDHILDLKVFIGNQVVRRDKRVCHLS